MMTYEETVNYLKSYRKLEYNLEYYESQMAGLKGISYTDEEKGTNRINTFDIYMSKIDETEQEMNAIVNFIETNLQGVHRNVISYKYIFHMTYSDIKNKIGYSISQISRFHNESIKILSKVDNK